VSSFFSRDELEAVGFESLGIDVRVSRRTGIYHPERISLGNHVRIDDFCVLSACVQGFIRIGSYVHIAAHCLVEAPAGLIMEDFSGLAGRCTVYGGTDDYSGEHLTNPCVPEEYRSCRRELIHMKKHALAGAGAVILPGVTIGICSAAGAMALVTKSIPDGEIHAGIPARYVKKRSMKLLDLEADLRSGFGADCTDRRPCGRTGG
jgi:galactoside O-acetyltransferase